MRGVGLLAFAAGALAAVGHGSAEMTESDMQVAGRVLSFMQSGPTGTIRVGIVYAPTNPQSSADAARLQQMLGGGLRAGNLVLQPVMVKIDEVASANVGLFFLADGVGPAASELRSVSSASRLPCITDDLAEVRAGACAIGVVSQPRVEILVNRATAATSGITFSTAFRMLITEL